jgi:hypothetical protein
MFRTRREMLKLVQCAPFLAPAFRSVLAADLKPPKRLVIVQRYNGAPAEKWFPANFNSFTGTSLEPLSDPKLKSKLVVLKNMTNKFLEGVVGDKHVPGARAAWAARAKGDAGVSLDQYIANKANLPTARKTLALGVYSQGIDQLSDTFFKAPGSPAEILDDPYDAINRVFGTFVPSGGTGGKPAVGMLARKQSILDAMKDDLTRVSRNVTGEEKAKLEQHLTFVRSAEMSLGNAMGDVPGASAACSKLTVPTTKYGVHDLVKLPEIAQVQVELVAMAMACDISRVFVIQMLSSFTNVGGGSALLPWCGANIAVDSKSDYRDGSGSPVKTLHQYHHATTGDVRERGIYANINTAYVKIFGELMKKLEAVPEGTGTLLDNSISVLGSEYGADYQTGTKHTPYNMPFLVAGGGGGFLKTNQMLDVGGASHTQLHGTLLEYFGLDDGSGSKSQDFGTRTQGYSYASLPGLKKA